MNILMAEDNPVIQMTYCARMQSWDYHVDIAANGQQAVEYAQNNVGKYDLCLMDIEMPIINGIEATKIIRKTVNYFPIVAFSASREYKQHCFTVGMDGFIEKPCLPDRLLAKIQKLTVKLIKVNVAEQNLLITKETPMNAQQTAVLQQLKEQNLSMISIFGTATEATFIVNEAAPLFIEKEFAENQKQSVRFLDHNPEGKGLCHLFAKTSMVVKNFMLDGDFARENQQEITKLKGIVIGKE